ncbi:BQ2448_4639 [Microbotryum intermedium]|uniref:BQ2448_4639 protein n=1 Tax=Microbotryum intermedium TaxID=269621 RepID=A0A238FFH1_9BASI|nr:BQ2448_4639 [Microbotryum intermedium]
MGWCSNSLTGGTSPLVNEMASTRSGSSISETSIISDNESFGLEGLAIDDTKTFPDAPLPVEGSPDSRRLLPRSAKRIVRKPVPYASVEREEAPVKLAESSTRAAAQDDPTCNEAVTERDVVEPYPVFRDSWSVSRPRYSAESRNSSLATSGTPALSDGASSRNSSFSSTTSDQSEPRHSSASSTASINGARRPSKRLSGSFNTPNGISIVASPNRLPGRSSNRRLSKSYDVEAFQLPHLPTLFPESPSPFSLADLAEPAANTSMLSPRSLIDIDYEVDPFTISVTPTRRKRVDSNTVRISCYDRVFYTH